MPGSKDTGVTTLDFAKAMIDEGYHPMTMYFPLVVHGAMLIEPTELELRASLDLFIASLRDLAMAVKRGDTERFTGAPYHAPRRRLDETRAARQPVLRWTKPQPVAEARSRRQAPHDPKLRNSGNRFSRPRLKCQATALPRTMLRIRDGGKGSYHEDFSLTRRCSWLRTGRPASRPAPH